MRTKSSKPNKEHRAFRIEPELWEKFKAACKKNNVSQGEILRICVAHYVEVNKDTSEVEKLQEAFECENVEIVNEEEILFPKIVEAV